MGQQQQKIPQQLHQLFERCAYDYPSRPALVCDEEVLTYQELEEKSNQLAHYFLSLQLQAKDVIGILLERSLESYITILAILKIGATYVPIEVEYPEERINYIIEDARLQAVVTSCKQKNRKELVLPTCIEIDTCLHNMHVHPKQPPSLSTALEENVCYIIYTSGSTGKPKGVEVTHKNICHYVEVASKIYEMQPHDRVYQGFSLAFDASLEEIWMAFANGAALIACKDKETRAGVGLMAFLRKQKVTVFSTVPTLLGSIEVESHFLRLLILGGEVCSAKLVNDWNKPGLRIINTYGPTEATVIATYAEVSQSNIVSIGKPLPGYKIHILDEHLRPVPVGVAGELCISGIGVAKGYVRQPTLTATRFIKNTALQNKRMYRTGDLAFLAPSGDLQFVGRVDDQVKIRGFRIELNEIEKALMEYPSITQAVVSVQPLEAPTLVGYLVLKKEAPFNLALLREHLKTKLPDYMIPALFECLEELPLLPSGKVDRKALPKPLQKTPEASSYHAPETPLETTLACLWQEILHIDAVNVTADFFYDLGGHSLLAAKVISKLRELPDFQTVSMIDIYQHPSIRKLAQHLQKEAKKHPHTDTQRPPLCTWKYYLCALGQGLGCLLQYGMSVWQLLFLVCSYQWFTGIYHYSLGKAALFTTFLFFFLPFVTATTTIALKWALLGRVKPGAYPLWSWFYLRWWLVQRFQQTVFEPKHLKGSPLLVLYYRLLGANIGKRCHIATTSIATPDLFTLGEDSSIGLEVRALGYIVEDGWLKIGTIHIGKQCYVGARSVLNMYTELKDQAILDDMSMLQSGTTIPKDQYFSGAPAKATIIPANHIGKREIKNGKHHKMQPFYYGLWHILALYIVTLSYYASFLPSAWVLQLFYQQESYLSTLLIATPLAALLFFCTHFLQLCVIKRLFLGKCKPGTYPVFSMHYLRLWTWLRMLDIDEIGVLADSLYFPWFLRCLGATIGKQVEMGEAPALIPDLLTIEKGGFTASGVALAWPAVHKGFIHYGETKIAEKAFIGNVSMVPMDTTIGKRSLLGCMTLPPSPHIASQKDAAWLGSPPIFLPAREVISGFGDEVTFNPAKKLYYTRLFIEFLRILLPSTCSLVLLCHLMYAIEYLLAHASLLTTLSLLPLIDMVINLGIVSALIGLKWGLCGRIRACIKPLWDSFIWKNDIREFSYGYYINPHLTDLILGTPFLAWLYRAMGAKIGKRTFIHTEGFAEFDLIEIGDDVCINQDTLIQTHLYEDRIFKLAALRIADGCNIGVGSMVLYNTIMEKNATLGSFSLLMKGERLPSHTYWEGSPAQSFSFLNKIAISVPEKAEILEEIIVVGE